MANITKLPRSYLYVGVVALLALGAVYVNAGDGQQAESSLSISSCFGEANDQPSETISERHTPPSLIPQVASERSYSEKSKFLFDHEYCSPQGVGRAMKVIAHKDLTFVLDTGYKTVHAFDSSCTQVLSYGNGEGRGPGELLYPTDFTVGNGFIWIADSRQRKVSKFTIDGTFVNRFATPRHPMRITRADTELALMQIGTPDLLQRLNQEGETTATFTHPMSVSGVESPEVPTMGMGEYGDLTRAPDGNIIFAPTLASYIFEYIPGGKLVRAFQTIDQFGFPSPEKESMNGAVRYVAPSRDIKVDDVIVDDDFVYVHTRIKQKDGGYSRSVVDVYDRSSGAYIKSHRLFEGIKSIHRSRDATGSDRYVAARDTSVFVFTSTR